MISTLLFNCDCVCVVTNWCSDVDVIIWKLPRCYNHIWNRYSFQARTMQISLAKRNSIHTHTQFRRKKKKRPVTNTIFREGGRTKPSARNRTQMKYMCTRKKKNLPCKYIRIVCSWESLLQFLQLKTGECGTVSSLLTFWRKIVHFAFAILIGDGAVCTTAGWWRWTFHYIA